MGSRVETREVARKGLSRSAILAYSQWDIKDLAIGRSEYMCEILDGGVGVLET